MTMAQFLNAASGGKPAKANYKFDTYEANAEWRMEL
jgi:hypothetical protein